MREKNWQVRALIGVTALCVAAACGDSSDDDGSAGTSAGMGGETGGSGGTGGGMEFPNSGDINLDCPDVPPYDGAQAARGECCHRVSNLEREKELDPDEDGVLEYRLQYQLTRNHPTTIGNETIAASGINRADREEGTTLWSFRGPRENGEEVSGMGTTTIGGGRYNCDGTYSYFSDDAAPVREGLEGRTDPARWAANEVEAVIDVTKTGRDRQVVPFAKNVNRDIALVPYVGAGTWELEWELATQGFDIETIETEGEARDCIGSREGMTWVSGGTFRIYSPMAPNDLEPIATAFGSTLCELTAFGLQLGSDYGCFTTERCEPGTADCPWVTLPDSLCPVTDDEKAMWGCHIGYEGNPGDTDYPDGYPTNCTADAPTEVLDPDMGATSEGQCCDPLGQSSTLPACNAWLLRQDYVAAAAEITDERSSELPGPCE